MKRAKIAYKKGYRITKNGDVVSMRNNKIIPITDCNGYNYFSCAIDGKTELVYHHRLQAYQKYGEKLYREGIECRHLNGNKTDNSYENIDVGTHSDNMMDMPKETRVKKAKHAASFLKKYDHEAIKEFHNGSYNETMEEFGISSKGTLNYILNTD